MAGLLIATLLSGLLWTLNGPHYLFGFSLLTLHVFLAVALSTLAIWHLLRFRWILRHPRAVGRRSFLQSSAILVAGFLLWRSVAKSKETLAISGTQRRFTGSFEEGSFSGSFPQVSWIADRPPPVDLGTWRLSIEGAVRKPLSISYGELTKMETAEIDAVLDCTGGWYSVQTWRGVSVAQLLELAGIEDSARSVSLRAVSGYERRFWLHETKQYLAASHVAGRVLGHGHGFPLRLVAPGQRGVNWVKWLGSIHVHTSSKHWQLPLPLK
jgi:DMSO/TMAO reductase YedYZ molybdopterin-dependent catalytic subunit